MDSIGSAARLDAANDAAARAGALTALRQAPLGVAIFDREMRYLVASAQFLTDQGMPGDMPLEGRQHYEVFPDIPQHWRDIHARVLAEGVELSHEGEAFERADGQLHWVRWSVAPWRTDDGEIGGLVLYTEEVTSRVEGDIDLRGILGLSNEVHNGYQRIRASFDIKGDAPAEKLREIVEQSRARSAVFDVLTNGVPVDVTVNTH